MKATRRISVNTEKPNAWIVNPTDRGRKSIKPLNKIYLEDGQEFQIELFNPLQDSVLTDIRVNGKSVSASGLVLRPGERFYLDCFVDDKKKFIFKTYEVESTTESKTAIEKNGKIEVFFYKEDTINFNNWTKRWNGYIERHYYPMWYNTHTIINTPQITWGGYGDCSVLRADSTYYSSTNNIIGSSTTGTVYSSNLPNVSYTNTSTFNTPMMETGRIEKGNESKQNFVEVDMEFEKYHISSVFYQLLPQSQKPVETTEIKKKFCDECGTKLIKETSKFCHECGNKI